MKAHLSRPLLFKQATLLLPVTLLLLSGCGSKETSDPVAQAKPAVYQNPDAEFPGLVFADGQVSVNDKCPVRKTKLNRRMPAVFANGRPVGFC